MCGQGDLLHVSVSQTVLHVVSKYCADHSGTNDYCTALYRTYTYHIHTKYTRPFSMKFRVFQTRVQDICHTELYCSLSYTAAAILLAFSADVLFVNVIVVWCDSRDHHTV